MSVQATYHSFLKTPIGLLELVTSATALKAIHFREQQGKANPNFLSHTVKHQLEEYFAEKRISFDLPLAPEGTNFQKEVWQALLQIPFGQTMSYSKLSSNIHNKKAVRAVGHANGQNPIPIVIPCHRVIGSNGNLVGYSGGLWRKKKLLSIEGYPFQKSFHFYRSSI